MVDEQSGAVMNEQCPEGGGPRTPRGRKGCLCGDCIVCGHAKHTVAHGPRYGHGAGSKPYDHEYQHGPIVLTETLRRKGRAVRVFKVNRERLLEAIEAAEALARGLRACVESAASTSPGGS